MSSKDFLSIFYLIEKVDLVDLVHLVSQLINSKNHSFHIYHLASPLLVTSNPFFDVCNLHKFLSLLQVDTSIRFVC